MPTAVSVSGSSVDTEEYLQAQTSLMGQFAVQALHTGPEQHTLHGEDWKHLDRVAHGGMKHRESWKVLSQHPGVSYLMQQWIQRYAGVFGPLAREARVPVEVVQSHVRHHQHAVVEHLSQLRYYWHEATGRSLDFQSAWAHVQWDGPHVRDIEGEQHSALFQVAALFPHVVRRPDQSVDLHLGTRSVSPQVMQVPIDAHVRERVEKDIAKY